jgi:demethylmenaquinone methyltransferase/2-methoxy-6-polyprenyl-1,4-benzoquinol methylase
MNNRPNATEVQSLFNRIAPVYDDLNQWLSLGQHRIWKVMAVKWAHPQPGDRGLDLCCGSGDLARLLAKAIGPSGSVVGIDFAAAQLRIAQERSTLLCPQLTFDWVEGDVLALPFASNTFDCATMGYGLRNVVDIPRALQEIHRVLKLGAKVAILDFHRPSQAVLQHFQSWYLDQVVVPLARRLGLSDEYAYIAPSLARFPVGTAQVQMALEAGFQEAVHYPTAGGLMGVLVATKGNQAAQT